MSKSKEPKYNIGDEVFPVFKTYCDTASRWELKKINICYILYEEGELSYAEYVDWNYGNVDDFPEPDCFPTLEEAQAECDRRNKENEQA